MDSIYTQGTGDITSKKACRHGGHPGAHTPAPGMHPSPGTFIDAENNHDRPKIHPLTFFFKIGLLAQ
jgi:hypothetical protein